MLRSWRARLVVVPLFAALATAAPASGDSSYVVRPGDSLTAIALRFGSSAHALARLNRLRLDAVLPAGRRLVVPGRAGRASRPGNPSIQTSIDLWAGRYGVNVHLVRAIAWMESGYQPRVVSNAGASGAMQVTPVAWNFVELNLARQAIPHTPWNNVRVGVIYFHFLLHQFQGRERLAVAAYYQGAASVRHNGISRETHRYADAVLALRKRL